MAKRDYYKRKETERPTWHENYAKKLEEHQAAIGITPEKLAQAQTDRDTVRREIDETEQAKQTYSARVSQKNTALDGIEARTRADVNAIKAHPGYTAAIGADLGIVGEEVGMPTSLEDMKPEVHITIMPGNVRHDWQKKLFDGIVVYSMRGAETTFTKLATDTRSPYDDDRPNLVAGVPEKRTYRYVYILNDVEVGTPLELSVVVLM